MKKSLSRREKTMMAILAVLLVAVGWFKLLYEPIRSDIDRYNTECAADQDLISTTAVKVASMHRMQDAIDEYKASGDTQPIPAYDNSKPLMVALNQIMRYATEYTLEFRDAEREDYICSRELNVSFSADSYSQARSIIDMLDEQTYVNQISGVKIITNEGESKNKTTVALTITFFEMVNE